MKAHTPRAVRGIAVIFVAALAGHAAPALAQTAMSAPTTMSPAERARADNGHAPYTQADLHFMTGMIGHHAQAILMAGWAPSHGAGPDVAVLCERIVVSQRDEINFMQRWLRDRHENVPDGDPQHALAMTRMPGMESMMMPGMLTADQLARLDAARGADFDRLFLIYMIQHHQGAVTMVQQLFDAPGAAQEEYVFKFANDVNADQTTEIARMNRMLDLMDSGGR
ncbi:MAG TPA: DUF305 domain-containing protein [Gemmatimonadales bacterium]